MYYNIICKLGGLCMNSFIKEQLNKCAVAHIPEFTDATVHLIIPKVSISNQEHIDNTADFVVNKCYLIQVADYIIHPYQGFTLHDNWNNGVVPQYACMKIQILKNVNKMIFVDGVGFDTTTNTYINYYWSGWLPKKAVTIIKNL